MKSFFLRLDHTKPEDCRFVRRGDRREKGNDVGEENEADGKVDHLNYVIRSEPAQGGHVFEGSRMEQ